MVSINVAKIRPTAKIVQKKDENGGWDLFPDFIEDVMIIKPHQTVMVPTGIATAFPKNFVLILKERGSTGTNGIGQRSGVVDSGYRGEIFAAITNETNYGMVIIKKELLEKLNNISNENNDDIINVHVNKAGTTTMTLKDLNNIVEKSLVINYEKAITQALLLEIPPILICETDYETLKSLKSERGCNKLGSTDTK